MYRQKKPKKVFNIRPFIYIGAGAIVLVIILLLVFSSPKTMMADRGELTYTGNFSSIIIREETVYETENYEKTVFIASEGEKLKKGANIAQVYKWGYNDSILNQLLDLQNEIKKYQETEKLKDINNVELKNFNDNISNVTNNIHQFIAGEKDADIISLERDLKKLMTERKDYLTDKAVTADDHLETLYAQEKELKTRIEQWQENIAAKADGIVSFYFDGCEQYMNVQNLTKLNKKNIEEVLRGETSTLADNDKAKRPLYRLVTANKWYVVIYTDDKIDEFMKNTKYTFSFQDIYDKKYTGKLLGERKDTRGYIYTFLMSDDVSALLRARRIDVKIENTFSGIKVPESAVKEKDGVYGVNVVDGNTSKFEPVNVLIKKNHQAVVTPVDANAILNKENPTVEY